MDLVQAEGSSAAAASASPASTVAESLSNGSFHALLRTTMLASSVAAATRTEFANTFVDQHADLRANVYLQLKSIAHLAMPDFQALSKEFGGSNPAGAKHIVDFMLKSDWKAELTKAWIVLPAENPDEEDLMALYGEIWMGILKHKMSVEMYKEILIQLHSVIIPALASPLLLADFLTDSYNIGQSFFLCECVRSQLLGRPECSHGFDRVLFVLLRWRRELAGFERSLHPHFEV
jgi:hypothetical protein